LGQELVRGGRALESRYATTIVSVLVGRSVLDNVRIVLVAPNHPGNIGGSARALKNMGLSRLCLVQPKRFPDPQADWRAASALDVLDATVVFDSVAEAVADCHLVIGTSTRSRRIPWPVVDAKELAVRVRGQDERSQVAILFGREDNGLTNDELKRCHCHLQIPANAQYPSLNLAMAVQIVTYELFQTTIDSQAAQPWDRKLATASQFEAMLAHLEETLTKTQFLDADNPGQTMTRLRRLFSRVQLDETETQILRGVLKHLGAAKTDALGPSRE
jgi:tRNA (cytidine32/uridine32-2'-O)-methyltransferase